MCLFTLSARFVGLGISDPVESALLAFLSSHEGACVLVDAIHGAAEFLCDNSFGSAGQSLPGCFWDALELCSVCFDISA